MGQALRGESLTVYGDGSQTRSFCFVVRQWLRGLGAFGQQIDQKFASALQTYFGACASIGWPTQLSQNASDRRNGRVLRRGGRDLILTLLNVRLHHVNRR